jgi:hypothetical protein
MKYLLIILGLLLLIGLGLLFSPIKKKYQEEETTTNTSSKSNSNLINEKEAPLDKLVVLKEKLIVEKLQQKQLNTSFIRISAHRSQQENNILPLILSICKEKRLTC